MIARWLGVVVQPRDQLHAADRQSRIDDNGFLHRTGEAGSVRAVLRGRAITADIAIESAIVHEIVRMPLSGLIQLRVEVQVIGAAGPMLECVNPLHERFVESAVVGNDCVVVVVGVGGAARRTCNESPCRQRNQRRLK
jgi:hypothetical protein